MLANSEVIEDFWDPFGVLADRRIRRYSGFEGDPEGRVKKAVRRPVLSDPVTGSQIDIVHPFDDVSARRGALVRSLNFEGKQAEPLFNFARDDVGMGVGYAGVEPVKTCLIDFRVRVIDQARFGEYPFPIGTAMIEQ